MDRRDGIFRQTLFGMIRNSIEAHRAGGEREIAGDLWLAALGGDEGAPEAGLVVVQCMPLEERVEAGFAGIESAGLKRRGEPFDGPGHRLLPGA